MTDTPAAPDPAGGATSTARAVARTLRALAPEGVAVGARAIDGRDLATLRPAELAAVRSAVDVRRHEFASGRALLRDLLGVDVELPVAPGGAPRLPPATTGSLAHDRRVVIAAVSTRRDVGSIGIDLEPDVPLDDDAAAIVVGPLDRVDDALLAFVQKEAVYKAWSWAGGGPLEHHEVVVESGADRFRARVTATGGRSFEGRHASVGGRRIALVVELAG